MSAPYLGDFKDQQTVHFIWDTTTGVADSEQFDGLVGIHGCVITTTDGFYVTGSNYTVVLQGATIDGQVVNAVLAHFSIENRFTNVSQINGATVTGDGNAAPWDGA